MTEWYDILYLMLTDKEFKQLERLLRKEHKALLKELHVDLQRIEKRLDSLEKSILETQVKSQNSVSKKLDKLLMSLERFVKIQRILEKKMRAIEDYFDPKSSN